MNIAESPKLHQHDQYYRADRLDEGVTKLLREANEKKK